MEITENQRLKIFRKSINKTQQQFADACSLKQGSYADVERGKVKVSGDIKNALNKDFSLNINWLETGNGEMQVEGISNAKPLHEISYPIEQTEAPFIEMGNGQLTMLVPYVDEYSYASFPGGFRDPEYISELRKVAITVDKRHKGKYFAFEIIGESMENYTSKEDAKKSIPDGSTVVGREIPRDYWKSKLHYHRWAAFVLVHKEHGVTCKTILDQTVTDGVIHLGSFNPDKNKYRDFTWHLDDIQAIFNIVRTITEP